MRLGARDASYDAQDRLIAVQITKRVTTPDGPEDATTSRAYSYDSDGYVDTWTDQNDGATTDLDYDVLGNLKQVSLPSGAVVSYESDAMQRRVVRRVDGEVTARWVYRDSLHPAAELDEAGNVVSTFVYAEEPNTPSYMVRNGTTYRIVSDHLGSVRAVVDVQTGATVQRLEYDDFGAVLMDTNPGFQPFGFAGGMYDHVTGLVRFGARDYDAVSARWTARDPILFAGGQANLYEYVGSDPVNKIDPFGTDMIDLTLNIGMGPGAFFGLSYDLDAGSLSFATGFGFGIGLGGSLGYTSTDEKDPQYNALSGPFVQGSLSGGFAGLGGAISLWQSGGADADGPGGGSSGTLGVGFGFGASLTTGISFPVYDPIWFQ